MVRRALWLRSSCLVPPGRPDLPDQRVHRDRPAPRDPPDPLGCRDRKGTQGIPARPAHKDLQGRRARVGPAGSRGWSLYVPLVARTAFVAGILTPDYNVTVTRIEAVAAIAPERCSEPAVFEVSDGTTTTALPIADASNDSGALAANFSAGVQLRARAIPGVGCRTPAASINVIVQYKERP